MKNSKVWLLAAVSVFSLGFTSCDEDETPEPPDSSFYATKLGGEVNPHCSFIGLTKKFRIIFS